MFFTDFAEPVTLSLASGPVVINGIFDNAFFLPELGEVDLETTQPRFMCQSKDVNELQRKDTVMVRGVEYSVLEIQPDGTGITTVVLAYES